MESSSRVLTAPNALSLARILLIPIFVWLIANEGTEGWGIGLLVLVASTDWVDGYLARRTGTVTELGKVLDPLADRLVLAAALVTFVLRGVFPLWAVLLVVVRDGLVLLGGVLLLAFTGRVIAVRPVGKAATFLLMTGIPLVAWGNFGLWGVQLARIAGWVLYVAGVALYYTAAGLYVGDFRGGFRSGRSR